MSRTEISRARTRLTTVGSLSAILAAMVDPGPARDLARVIQAELDEAKDDLSEAS